MIPMETLSEKKIWLIASSRICRKRLTVSPSKLGVRYTARPCRPVRVTPESSVWLSVSAKIAMAMIMTSMIGIRILEYFSIPFSTPLKTIHAVSSMKMTA